MKLDAWLKLNNVSRSDFARRIGVSKGAISQICNQENAWVSRETATHILRETQGAVTPIDFLAPNQFLGPGLFVEKNPMPNSVNEAIEAIARGEIVVVTDDDDRENEGDSSVAASLCTPEKMAFIIRNCCGIVCAPITADDARRLHLAPMVAHERRAARHRLHGLGRRPARADDGDLRRAAHAIRCARSQTATWARPISPGRATSFR